MDIHTHIVKLLDVLHTLEEPVTRLQLAKMMSSSVGEDDNFWLVMTEKAVHEGLVKTKPAKSKTVAITPAGKKFRKEPAPIEVHPEESSSDDELSMKLAIVLSQRRGGGELARVSSEHTRLQIKLIKAIDRKIALDDFAEQEHLDFDTVLDELDKMLLSGHRFNIRYFVDEVIEKDDTQEILDFFDANGDNMKLCADEWGDVYKTQELRLIHYLWETR